MSPAPESNEPSPRLTTAHRMNRLLAEAQERVLALVDDSVPEDAGVPPLRAARNCMLTLLGMALGFWAFLTFQVHLAPEVVYDEGSMQRAKVAHFNKHADEYDLVFVGTSRVYRSFDPELFEGITTDAGRPLRAYNFALRGMPFPEMRHTVEWILSRRPARLRYVVMELTGDLTRTFGRPLHRENAYTDRVVAWHDAKETAFLIEAVLRSDESVAFQVDAVVTHLLHFLRRFTSTGVGLPLARRLLGYPEQVPAFSLPENGHRTFEEEAEADPAAREAMVRWLATFHADHSEYDQLLAELRSAPRSGSPDPVLLEGIRDVAEEVRAAGAVPIFVVMPPHWTDGLEVLADGKKDLGGALLDYGDPDRYPEFYEYDHLYNVRHLNAVGTELFTRRFAEDFLGIVQTP